MEHRCLTLFLFFLSLQPCAYAGWFSSEQKPQFSVNDCAFKDEPPIETYAKILGLDKDVYVVKMLFIDRTQVKTGADRYGAWISPATYKQDQIKAMKLIKIPCSEVPDLEKMRIDFRVQY
jgi:hypothetical protein